ncbi:kinase-like domain-containing protein [Mycena sp. CBHHK59/15]|nr:kinase-like domain-containing protein [Mycena sp. CBHHK59/15]
MDSEPTATLHDLTEDQYDLIEEGPASTVSRTWTAFNGREPQWIVAKSGTVHKKFSKEPHDIVKELRILSNLSHVNIIPVLSHFRDTTASMLTIYLPYISHSLSQLLASPSFSPFSSPPSPPVSDDVQEARMTILAKSIAFQTLSALAYLHGPAHGIAHRDIKPANIMLTPQGRATLIDFGIAWEGADADKQGDLWPEDPAGMYFEVSTGAYRAPELLFGARAYDATAIDMWSFGCVLAEMFSALRLCSNDDDEGEEAPTCSAQAGDPPFVILPRLKAREPDTEWSRDTLFNGRRGEIGLAWSIFKIRGTPTDESWPVRPPLLHCYQVVTLSVVQAFRDLPGASSVEFTVVSRVPLVSFLPNLPPNSTPVLDLIENLLAYPPTERLQARNALGHAWFAGEVLLPHGYALDELSADGRIVFEIDNQELGSFVGRILT